MADFVLLISNWYRLNARELPWRSTKNPYFIWLSEVILQQTRVDQGLNYYLKFIEKYPILSDLANANEASVLKLWQGLGYYSRARNLHKTAQQVRDEYQGEFPQTYQQIIQLKGIGPYTAAAISSFAFDLPHAVVDGNVYRVLSRYYGIDEAIDSGNGKKLFQELADSLIPTADPALFNQAIMEFGAIHCVPNNPDCDNCILTSSCASAFNPELIKKRPFKKGKTKVRKRYFHYLHLEKNQQIALDQRTGKDVWEKLYEFPLIESESESVPAVFKDSASLCYQTKHILSHQHIYAYFYKSTETEFNGLKFVFTNKKDLHDYPIHRLMEKYLESNE
ncbi:A/G-specific adenine glycosylase [Fluviicola sp.]|jgi:A/G-specific adenine glycosylase|uniref:A/G-specific adenine glycosylase n=1 Tax=Fluviicola sp. TaxID=1917219 RepID=UPI002817420D|nr:A/G-specific adenine glycosylase [Fluviicola sp.]MDR0802510.1 A/G-specific adenine glycosylase [Fluviicola sp.]